MTMHVDMQVLRGGRAVHVLFAVLLIRAASAIVNHDIMVLFLGLSAPSSAVKLRCYCLCKRVNAETAPQGLPQSVKWRGKRIRQLK
ncbi:hypothetical protein V8C40DRAFT_236344 [Trichoderma camerunense]